METDELEMAVGLVWELSRGSAWWRRRGGRPGRGAAISFRGMRVAGVAFFGDPRRWWRRRLGRCAVHSECRRARSRRRWCWSSDSGVRTQRVESRTSREQLRRRAEGGASSSRLVPRPSSIMSWFRFGRVPRWCQRHVPARGAGPWARCLTPARQPCSRSMRACQPAGRR
jgi:hypothetical protein